MLISCCSSCALGRGIAASATKRMETRKMMRKTMRDVDQWDEKEKYKKKCADAMLMHMQGAECAMYTCCLCNAMQIFKQ